MSFLRIGILVMTAALLDPIVAFAENPSSDGTVLAARVTELTPFRSAVLEAVGSQLPGGTATELGTILVDRDELFWASVRSDLAVLLEERMPPKALEAASTRFIQDAGGAWEGDATTLLAMAHELLTSDTDTRWRLATVSCSVGILAPQIDRARERAAAAGKTLEVTPELVAAMDPGLGPVFTSCRCLMESAVDRFGAAILESSSATAEQEAHMLDLIATGQCPDPMAAWRSSR